jgi:putative thioredoxin
MKDASQTGWVIDVGDEDFEQEVLERSKQVPVLIDFWAPWCQPCRLLSPVLEALAKEKAGGFVLAKVNIDEAQGLAGHFQIESIPTVHVARDGQVYQGFQGVLPEEELRSVIDQIVPSDEDNAATEAFGLEATDPAQAEKLYRDVLSRKPDHEQARVGLARVLVDRHQLDEAKQLLAPLGVTGDIGTEAERLRQVIELEANAPAAAGDETGLRQKVAADPEDAKARYELGSFLASSGRYPEALEELMAAAERDKELAKNEVRELMVKIFQIIGVRSEMSDAYRDKLRALLY